MGNDESYMAEINRLEGDRDYWKRLSEERGGEIDRLNQEWMKQQTHIGHMEADVLELVKERNEAKAKLREARAVARTFYKTLKERGLLEETPEWLERFFWLEKDYGTTGRPRHVDR
jgi:predicted  nucleic acid-binding Zn-ribbon protein